MLTLNLDANRELREGDRVQIRGRYAQVVGFDLHEVDTPIVIQFPLTEGSERELVAANDVEYVGNFREAPDTLEPLPEIASLLTEKSYWTCGRILCVKLAEEWSTLSFVPKEDSVRLSEVFDQAPTVKEAVDRLLEIAFVTRRPHLVQIGESKQILQLLGSVSPVEAAIHLTA